MKLFLAFSLLIMLANCRSTNFAGSDKKKSSPATPATETKTVTDTDTDTTTDTSTKTDTTTTTMTETGTDTKTGTSGTDTKTGTSGTDTTTTTGGVTENKILDQVVTKVVIKTIIDHDSYIVIKNNEIYWRHIKLGVPQSTTVEFYNNEKLINAKPWVPQFANGRGPNCNNKFTMRWTLYCESDCECWSDKIVFGKGSSIAGNVSNFTGRGQKKKTGNIEIHLYDPQDGASAYSFVIQ